MAKCPKCSSRKGKRHCPALDTMICSACCGEHRFTEISCTEDCVYLGQEPYHQQRRMDRSRSQGRHFLKAVSQSVANEIEWDFALRLFVIVFTYNQRNDTLTDGEILAVLKELRMRLGRIIVPGQSPHPLCDDLESQCENDPALSTKEGFSTEDRVAVLSAVENTLARKAGDSTYRISELLDSFFGPLNLKADLGFDPDLGTSDPAEFGAAYRERPSGLILPPS